MNTKMRVEFTVTGHPPKKHGEKSMWARDDEAPKVASLREKASEAMSKAGLDGTFESLVSLELRVFVPKSQLESVGDLDNFITGVCDSLQAADSKVLPYLDMNLVGLKGKSDPKHPLLISNDAKVVSIIARKIALEENQNIYYEVAVEPFSQDILSQE
ncbi:hypothetical protein ES703_81752 [subsurface metagenome]